MKNNFFQNLTIHKRFWIILSSVIVLDQLSKIWTQATLPLFHALEIIPSFLYWTHTQNSGAAWGFFKNQSHWLGILGILVLLGLFLCKHHLELHRKNNQYAWGLMIGGIIGNAIDRFTYGHVIDFIDFYIETYHWPTFNFADAAITIGAFIYILGLKPSPNTP